MNRAEDLGAASRATLWQSGIARAVAMMRAASSEKISLRCLAKAAAMSPFHFERIFLRITGLRPFQFLSALRLANARDLVLNTNMSITDICFQVGYSSLGTFVRRFTESVGMSPGRLRKFAQRPRDAVLRPRSLPAPDVKDCKAEIAVSYNRLSSNLRVFVGAFPSPMPIGRPLACATARATTSLILRNVPPGTYYLFGATCPVDECISDELLVGVARPAPIQVDSKARYAAALQLRPMVVTDPPILSFLPLLVDGNSELSDHDEVFAVLRNTSGRVGRDASKPVAT